MPFLIIKYQCIHKGGKMDIKRQPVAINIYEMKKLVEIEAIRPDLRGYNVSKKVHVILQEWLRENLKKQENKQSSNAEFMYSGHQDPLFDAAAAALT